VVGILSFPELNMRAAPEVMPFILLCWPTVSEADADSVVVEVETS